MIRTLLTRSKESTCNPAGRPSRDEKDTDLNDSRDDWEWFFCLVLYCITGHKLILHQKRARAKICVSKRSTKILIKLKDWAILCVKSGEFMVFPTFVLPGIFEYPNQKSF